MALKVFRAVYGSKELYDAYVRAGIQEALSDPRPSIPQEKFWADLERWIAARRSYTYTVELAPAEHGGYVATIPALPGVTAEGRTVDVALAAAEDAIERRLEELRQLGSPLPEEDEPLRETIRVQVTVEIDPPR